MVDSHPGFDAAALAGILGHDFKEPHLLREAMTHPSLDAGGRGRARFGYERLEFLGDRVLGLVIAEWLMELFPDEAEGAIAKRYSALVRRDSLAEVAISIGLGPFLLLSPGEEEAGGRDSLAILSDAYEAVIAALYLDGGLDAAARFVRAAFAGRIDRNLAPPEDPKTALQEWAQGRGLPLPSYETLGRSGPDHEPVFEVRVTVRGQPPAIGTGLSKQLAAKAAASALLDQVRSA